MRWLFVSAVLLAAAGAAGAGEPARHVVVFFSSWSARLDDQAMKSVQSAADWAKQHSDQSLAVIGYASTVGSTTANQDLSRLRAQVVADTLVADGVPLDRIKRESKGPVDYSLDPLEARRVEIALGAP